MKKTKSIQLILITASLAGCYLPIKTQPVYSDTYDDCDSTGACVLDTAFCYSPTYHSQGGAPYIWRYAFRPYGCYYNGKYTGSWHYSGNLHASPVTRGGFGSGASSVSS